MRRCAICSTQLKPANRTRCCAECRLIARNGAFADEVWLPIVGHPGFKISDRGRICDHNGQIVVPNRSHRYPRVTLNGRRRYVHQLMAETWLGPRPFGKQVLHDDDDPANITLPNIGYGTPTQNAADRSRNQRKENR